MSNFYREEVEADFEFENRLLQASGVKPEEAEFIANVGKDWFEVGVVTHNGQVKTWFTSWIEARKFVMTAMPDKNWEESGWRLH